MDSLTIYPSSDGFRESEAYREAIQFLFDRIDYERVVKMPYTKRDLNLSRMRRLLELLGDPHQRVRAIHVAGTKGKGSVAAFLTATLTAAGYHCGSYSSPHLHAVEERFVIDGEPCTPQTLVALVEQIRPVATQVDRESHGCGPTYFELCTAMAFQHFATIGVDVAVIEVGLGGRLDSTNVCTPLVSVITSISYDHTKQLGNTLTLIAGEKAGIIKPGVPVVSGATGSEARETIEAVSHTKGSQLSQIDSDFRASNYQPPSDALADQASTDIEVSEDDSWHCRLHATPLGLLGAHQAQNAATAYAATQQLPGDLRVDERALRVGFASARCAARIEIVRARPLTIVDAAHNVASTRALVQVLREMFGERPRWLLLATTRGKDVSGMLRVLLPAFQRVICTRYLNNPRAYDVRKLEALAKRMSREVSAPCDGTIQAADEPRQAFELINRGGSGDRVLCATGSFFIAAEIRELVAGL